MLPRAIDFIKRRKSGKYALSDPGFEKHGVYFMVEVDEQGNVYQLTPQGERDGAPLRDDHWVRQDVQAYFVSADASLFVRLA